MPRTGCWKPKSRNSSRSCWREGLLRPATAAPVSQGPIQVEPQPFSMPILHKYTDLEALLLIDPVHDVTTQGWPNLNKTDQA